MGRKFNGRIASQALAIEPQRGDNTLPVEFSIQGSNNPDMAPPHGFTWIEQPFLSASAMPDAAEELAWLREQRIDILLSLAEEPPTRRWIDEAGLMLVHVPVSDFEAPTAEQFDKCLAVLKRAKQSAMGVNVHCQAGRGRTGTVLAAYFVSQGMAGRDAVQHVRNLRPGSIETPEQERAVLDLARRLRAE
jgi:atypical dual specificity phosphatase